MPSACPVSSLMRAFKKHFWIASARSPNLIKKERWCLGRPRTDRGIGAIRHARPKPARLYTRDFMRPGHTPASCSLRPLTADKPKHRARRRSAAPADQAASGIHSEETAANAQRAGTKPATTRRPQAATRPRHCCAQQQGAAPGATIEPRSRPFMCWWKATPPRPIDADHRQSQRNSFKAYIARDQSSQAALATRIETQGLELRRPNRLPPLLDLMLKPPDRSEGTHQSSHAQFVRALAIRSPGRAADCPERYPLRVERQEVPLADFGKLSAPAASSTGSSPRTFTLWRTSRPKWTGGKTNALARRCCRRPARIPARRADPRCILLDRRHMPSINLRRRARITAGGMAGTRHHAGRRSKTGSTGRSPCHGRAPAPPHPITSALTKARTTASEADVAGRPQSGAADHAGGRSMHRS